VSPVCAEQLAQSIQLAMGFYLEPKDVIFEGSRVTRVSITVYSQRDRMGLTSTCKYTCLVDNRRYSLRTQTQVNQIYVDRRLVGGNIKLLSL